MTEIAVQSSMYCVVNDQEAGEALHEAIVEAACAAGLAGASVLQAIMGYSRGGFLYSDLLNEVFSDRPPVIVEIVDQPERISAFVPTLHALVRGRRLIAVERAEVVLYKSQGGA